MKYIRICVRTYFCVRTGDFDFDTFFLSVKIRHTTVEEMCVCVLVLFKILCLVLIFPLFHCRVRFG